MNVGATTERGTKGGGLGGQAGLAVTPLSAGLGDGDKARSSQKSVLRFVKFGDGQEIVGAGAGQVLLGKDIFQNNRNGELLPLPGEPQCLIGGSQAASGGADLVGLGLQACEGVHDLAGNLVADFFRADPGRTEAGLGRALA